MGKPIEYSQKTLTRPWSPAPLHRHSHGSFPFLQFGGTVDRSDGWDRPRDNRRSVCIGWRIGGGWLLCRHEIQEIANVDEIPSGSTHGPALSTFLAFLS